MSVFKQPRFILPLLIFILIIGFLWRGLSLHPNQIPSPLINHAAPAFELPDLYNPKKTINQNVFLGQVTLLNVWATWCYACAEEHDELVELASHEHVNFMGLNYKDDSTTAKQWLKEKGNPYQHIAVDEAGNAAIDWGVYGAPETFIIDKKGIIRYKHIGPITPENWQHTLKPFIEKMNKEAP